ncbi:MAG TPA: sialidase family protein [Candidatus Dormibacteraeota bacterium]|nr:sialidase family protein [Candidatus Dormibacteraeota bacterium]
MRKIPRALPLAIALAAALAASPALAASSVHQVTNAGNDPYVACAVGSGGTSYPRSEVEPFGSVNQANPANVITVTQQDRWSNGGARGLDAGVTMDGGASWTVVPLPFSACAANAPADLQYERASDPWVSFGPGTAADHTSGATAYAISISFNQSVGKNGNTVGVAASSDGGLTWAHAQSMHADAQSGVPIPVPDSNFQFFHDKESITADPTTPGTAYAVWDVLIGPNANVDADLTSSAFTDDTLFSRTTDFGATWSPVRVINTSANPTSQNNQTIGNVIVVDPRTGTLYDFFNQIFNTGSNSGGNPDGAHGSNVAFQKSTDDGLTWTDAQLVASINALGVADPNNVDPRTGKAPAPFRVGDGIPEPAIDPETGDLYVTWEDARFSGHDEALLTRSTDGGATWSAPKRVSTPGGPAFTPAVAVTDSGRAGVAGTVGVTYYQLGASSPGSSPTTYSIKRFSAAAAGDSSSVDTGVAATTVLGPFNMLDAPFALGHFTGDYEGLLTTGRGAGASFLPVVVAGACGASLSCRALTSVVVPTNTAATGNDSTDLFFGTGF